MPTKPTMPGMKWVFYLCLSVCATSLWGCGEEQKNPLVEVHFGTKRFEDIGCPFSADLRAWCTKCVEDLLAQDNQYVQILLDRYLGASRLLVQDTARLWQSEVERHVP